ncbi:sensor domain-containing phosphodiesterase [Actinoplanes awajinensis]|uniref:sensor domain-containing phosphodiesterase n=1 Tax=Actinoplanes awajinensis TaxID=135946 RepID=UPI0018DC18CD|nr:EAL domain-containing protein [Actinoplanes awajinensis]
MPLFPLRAAAVDDVARKALYGIAQTRRVVSVTIAVLAASMLMSLCTYVWDWADVFLEGDVPEGDEWLALAGILWIPVAAATGYRLVRVHRELADTAQAASDAYHDAAETAQGWVWRVDPGHRFVYSNPAIADVLGYRPDEILGRCAVDMLFLEQDRATIIAAAEVALATGGWQNQYARMLHRDGSTRHVRSSATAVYDKRGRIVAYQGFTTDISAEVAAHAAEDAERARRKAARASIERLLRDPDGLTMVFQPIAAIDGRHAAGWESLARFAGVPYRTPDVWFAEAWEVGLGPELELHAIALACRQLPEVPAGVYLSVNASPRTILDERLDQLLAGLGADAARIVVEVTEHAAVADYDTLNRAVQRLRRRGVRLAVDDAGAGYASMQHILRLRPDVIKLDRSIVADIDHDVARRALVTAMAGFADSLGMTVVGEGVETAAELAALAAAGVRYAQGFLLAAPASVAELRVFDQATGCAAPPAAGCAAPPATEWAALNVR